MDEDDDSGADSLECHSCHGGGTGRSMALVPYDPYQGCCYGHGPRGWQSTALQTIPGMEERLLKLEGDKESLHLQVRRKNCT